MPAVTLSIYLGHRLDHESCHKPEKKSSGPYGCSWTTWTLQTIYHFCHTAISRCRKKTSDMNHTSVQVGLKVNKQKTKILQIKASTDEPVTIEEGGTGGS